MLFQVEPHYFSNDFFTIEDIIYLSGGDDAGDFEDAHLVHPPCCSSPLRLNTRKILEICVGVLGTSKLLANSQ